MCLGVPGRVIEVYEQDGIQMGRIDFGGIVKEICLAYVPEATVGEYVIVHAGFAISRLNEQEAQETLALLQQMGTLEEELNAGEDEGTP